MRGSATEASSPASKASGTLRPRLGYVATISRLTPECLDYISQRSAAPSFFLHLPPKISKTNECDKQNDKDYCIGEKGHLYEVYSLLRGFGCEVLQASGRHDHGNRLNSTSWSLCTTRTRLLNDGSHESLAPPNSILGATYLCWKPRLRQGLPRLHLWPRRRHPGLGPASSLSHCPL